MGNAEYWGLISRVSSRTYREQAIKKHRKMSQTIEGKPFSTSDFGVDKKTITQVEANMITNMSQGAVIGGGIAVLFSLRARSARGWPLMLGLGFGAGQSWQERNYIFNQYRYQHNIVVPKEQECSIGNYANCASKKINSLKFW